MTRSTSSLTPSGQKCMLLVVDTNIIVNYFLSNTPNAKSKQLLEDVFTGVHTMCISPAIIKEYREVLQRERLGIPPEDVDWFLSWVLQNSIQIEPKPTSQKDVEMRHDESDRVFFDVAKCLNVRLVTRNYKHYPVHELITLIDELYPSHDALEEKDFRET